MKKIAGSIVCLIVLASVLCGCTDDNDQDDAFYKGIESAPVPDECIDYKDDVCALYDCMVENCWCDDAIIPSPILYEPADVVIASEDDAIALVELFIQDEGSEYSEYSTITQAVQLNDVFYNVFAENDGAESITFTVAADGIIFLTTCGV